MSLSLSATDLNLDKSKSRCFETSKPVNPSNVLWALKRKLSNLRGVPFDFNTQQDVAEILQVVLEELKGVSLAS